MAHEWRGPQRHAGPGDGEHAPHESYGHERRPSDGGTCLAHAYGRLSGRRDGGRRGGHGANVRAVLDVATASGADVSRPVRDSARTVTSVSTPAAPAVDVVFPVLDEAAALPWVLGRVPAGYRPIVVDNGSTDGSAMVAADLGAVVVSEPRRGFGAACAAGLAAATAPVVAFCDADASLDPADLPRVCAPVADGEADLVLGARVPVGRGAWPAHARLANRYLARRVRRVAGTPLRDIGPMRAAPPRRRGRAGHHRPPLRLAT